MNISQNGLLNDKDNLHYSYIIYTAFTYNYKTNTHYEKRNILHDIYNFS